MDPKQHPNQPNQNSGASFNIPAKGPLDSNQAADLIRHQLNAIYGQQPGTAATPAPAQDSGHFNPFSDPAQQPPAQPQPIPQQQQPLPQPAPPPQPAPYYNPYHNTDSQQAPAPQQQPTQQPGAAPGTDNYRNNYSTFAIPGSQPQAAPHTPQVTEPAPIATMPTPAAPSIHTPQVTEPAPIATMPTPAAPSPHTEQVAVADDLTKQTSIGELKDNVVKRVAQANQKKKHSKWKPLFVSLMVGVLFLGVNYNEIAIAQVKQYISPGDAINTPVIINPEEAVNVGMEPRIIIPKINLDVPVVYDEPSYEEDKIQAALERGTVHYGDTPLPGEIGNNVIIGHSSNNYFNSGDYKFAFVLLFRLEEDDTFILNYEGTRYVYRVFSNRVVEPNDFSVIEPTNKPIVTLITCTPPGTSWKRLIIQAEQISPNPADAIQPTGSGARDLDQLPSTVPSNAPSLWNNIRDSIF